MVFFIQSKNSLYLRLFFVAFFCFRGRIISAPTLFKSTFDRSRRGEHCSPVLPLRFTDSPGGLSLHCLNQRTIEFVGHGDFRRAVLFFRAAEGVVKRRRGRHCGRVEMWLEGGGRIANTAAFLAYPFRIVSETRFMTRKSRCGRGTVRPPKAFFAFFLLP